MSEERKADLPEWVEDLLESSYDKGYRKGWDDGARALWYQVRDLVEKGKPYNA